MNTEHLFWALPPVREKVYIFVFIKGSGFKQMKKNLLFFRQPLHTFKKKKFYKLSLAVVQIKL